MQELKRKLLRAWSAVWADLSLWLNNYWFAMVVAFLAGWWCAPAQAATAEIGVSGVTYNSDRLDIDDPGVTLKAGYKGLYVWSSWQNPNIRLVGQRMGGAEVIGYGLGVERQVGQFRPFVEYGYFDPRETTNTGIRNEAVVTELNNNHGWRGNRHFETTEYNLSGAYGGRVGVLWDANDHLAFGAAYQFIKLDEQLQAYNGICDGWPPIETCGSWWVENRKLNLSAVMVGVYGRF